MPLSLACYEGETALHRPQKVSNHIHTSIFTLYLYQSTMHRYLEGYKGWKLHLTYVQRDREDGGILAADMMYKKRYRYYIRNCYYTMTIFYPVSVDVIFIECFDPV